MIKYISLPEYVAKKRNLVVENTIRPKEITYITKQTTLKQNIKYLNWFKLL